MKKNFFELVKNAFCIEHTKKCKIIANVHSEMNKGLFGEKSSLKMIPSFVWLPTGDEEGIYLVIDFGGTNFRVMAVSLNGHGIIGRVHMRSYEIGRNVISGTKDDLGDFIVDAVFDFMQKDHMDDTIERKIGFTFSFPVEQKNIISGTLITWTKGFVTSGVVGEDVSLLVNDAFAKRGFSHITIGVMTNDTVGTLSRGRYSDANCSMGVIIGTGTNAAYVERVLSITKDPTLYTKTGEMIVNMEWGGFDLIARTKYDVLLDDASLNKGEQFLEKMVSAKYLGKLTSLILRDFIDRGEFSSIKKNSRKDCFSTTRQLSQILADDTESLSTIEMIMDNCGYPNTSKEDRILIKEIVRLVLNRSACIIGAMIVAVITKIDPLLERKHTIAIDGSLYENVYGYKNMIKNEIDLLTGKHSDKISPFVCKDGSGIGVAIIAATITKIK
jgi:hexokinase